MPTSMLSRALVATTLLLATVVLQIMPIGSFLHEVAEHDALESSHCACLICHSTAHAPMDVGGEGFAVCRDDHVTLFWLSEAHSAPTPKFHTSVFGRAPPSV